MSRPTSSWWQRWLGRSDAVTIEGAGTFARTRPGSHVLMWFILGFFVVMIVWAAVAEVDTVTRADGKVVPSARLQVLQSLEGGLVAQIEAKQGQFVKQGDLLVLLNPTQFGSDFQARNKQVMALQARAERFLAQTQGREPVFAAELRKNGAEFVANELAAYLSKMGEHQAQLAMLEAQVGQKEKELKETIVTRDTAKRTLEHARSEMDIVAMMVKRGLEPQLELVRLQRVMADAEGRAEGSALMVSRLTEAVKETQSRKLSVERQLKAESAAELNRTLTELRALEESMPALKDKLSRTEMRAPLSGIVNRVLVSTLGGVVKPGDPVAEVVPADDQLMVEALVQPKDIGFVHIGQPAKVKLTAYDYSIYGAMDGTVATISADAVPMGDKGQAFYQVRIETSTTAMESLGKKLPIIPGMQAQVDIVTGSKSVLRYITKPLTAVKENAFRER